MAPPLIFKTNKTMAKKVTGPGPKKKFQATNTMVTGPGGKVKYSYAEGVRGGGQGGIKKDDKVFLNPKTKAPMISEMVRAQRTIKAAPKVAKNLLGVTSKKKK